MDVSFIFVVTFLLGFCLLLVIWAYRLQGYLGAADAHVDELEREISSLRRLSASLGTEIRNKEADYKFLSQFIREFPHLTRDLHSQVKARRIPEVLLRLILRAFEPEQALVLLRRRQAESEPGRGDRLVTAAVHPENGPVRSGVEIVVGTGKLGLVAQVQRTMSHYDFQHETPLTRQKIQMDNLPGFEPDLVAPMVFDEKTVGLLALSKPKKNPPETKEVLRLIAQIGALAVHNVVVFRQMKFTADVDGLTGIFNKRRLLLLLGEHIYEAQQQLSSVSIFLCDIDNFKNYNDVNGHVAGDTLLRLLASLVKENIREEDIFGRFGGEEFLLILPNTSSLKALEVAEKIRLAISDHDFPFAERQPLGVLSVSGGVATYPDNALDSADLLRVADEALYDAKRQGRNRVLLATRRGSNGDAPEGVVVDRDLFGEPEEDGSQ